MLSNAQNTELAALTYRGVLCIKSALLNWQQPDASQLLQLCHVTLAWCCWCMASQQLCNLSCRQVASAFCRSGKHGSLQRQSAHSFICIRQQTHSYHRQKCRNSKDSSRIGMSRSTATCGQTVHTVSTIGCTQRSM